MQSRLHGHKQGSKVLSLPPPVASFLRASRSNKRAPSNENAERRRRRNFFCSFFRSYKCTRPLFCRTLLFLPHLCSHWSALGSELGLLEFKSGETSQFVQHLALLFLRKKFCWSEAAAHLRCEVHSSAEGGKRGDGERERAPSLALQKMENILHRVFPPRFLHFILPLCVENKGGGREGANPPPQPPPQIWRLPQPLPA